MAKVSTDGMRGTAGEIKSLIDILKNRATSTGMGAERMSQAASILTGYNGQIVQGTVVNTNQFDGKHVSHYKEYQTWIINTNGVEELASSVAKKAEALEAIASKISGEADVINSISEQIEGYITTIQSTIGDNISATAITTAFKALGQNGVTKANLAVSGDLINNRDFLDFDQIKTDPNLQGGVLTFEKQDDGTYKVLKNGGGTGYYTTGLAAAFYMKTLVRANNQISQQKTEISVKDTIPEQKSVNSENYNNHKIENLQSDFESIKDMKYFVENRQDIVIPKGKHLYIDGQKTIGTDYTFRYNEDTGKYHIVMSNGNFSNTSYTLYEMSKAEIK